MFRKRQTQGGGESEDFIKAALRGDATIVARMLADNPALVNSKVKGYSPLIDFLALRGHTHIVRLLLQANVDLNLRQHASNGTALHAAAGFAHVEIVDLLLEAGADVNARDNSGSSPLHSACHVHRNGACSWHFVSLTGEHSPWYQVAKRLLEAGAEVEVCTDNRLTPLHIALRFGNADLVRLLLSHNADVTARYEQEHSSLHYVNSLESMELVVAAGAEIDARNTQGQTPLMIDARMISALSRVRFLLDHGADINARDIEGKTALTYVLTLQQYASQNDIRIDSRGLEAMIALLQERGGVV